MFKTKTLLSIVSATVVLICVLFIGKVSYAEDDSIITFSDTEIVTVTINYYYYNQALTTSEDYAQNGERPYPAFVANMPKGSTTIEEKTPTLTGYAPDSNHEIVSISFEKNYSVDVLYYPTEVHYQIRINKQNLNDDDYTLSEILNRTGTTGTIPTEFEDGSLENRNGLVGFTLMYHVPDVIAADGSTQFECYYDRNYYLVDVELGSGGYGVESIYAKYGSVLDIGVPKRTGYTFGGWKIVNTDTGETLSAIPSTIPANNLKLTAIWKTTEKVKYRIVYKTADLQDGTNSTTYSYWSSTTETATAGTSLSRDEIISAYKNKPSSLGLPDNQYFEFDDATTKANNDPEITVSGDGSTLIKLYYKRKSYTIRFVYARKVGNEIQIAKSTGDGDYTVTGTNKIYWDYKVASVPTVDTSKLKTSAGVTFGTGSCSDTEYTSAYSSNTTLYYITLTAEYGANIENVWPTDVFESITGSYGSNSNCTFSFGSWAMEKGLRTQNTGYENMVGSYPTMSSNMISSSAKQLDDGSYLAQTMYAWWGAKYTNFDDLISDHIYYIYYESLDGSGETPDTRFANDDGTLYKKDRTITFQCAHNDTTQVFPFTYVGFTLQNTATRYYSKDYPENGSYMTKYYYKRNTHTLKFYNYNATYGESQTVKYGTSLESFKPSENPPYPKGLETGKYAFDGWYTDDTYENEFNWAGTMPDNDVIVYAYWKPKTYTINFYSDESSYLNGGTAMHSTSVAYADFVNAKDISIVATALKSNTPSYTVNGKTQYAKQVGWFYYDTNNVKHAFDLETMSVSSDMNLFMSWTTTVPTFFNVHYVLNGTDTQVAMDTTGTSFVGITRTFTAKTNSDLYEGYEKLFPNKSSTSILMNEDETKNEATFNYFKMDNVPYTVNYVNIDTGEILDTKQVETNTDSVVTEKYMPISGYIPTAYYISLTLTVTENGEPDTKNNVITFYYKQDTSNMLCHIKYLLEDDNGTYVYNDTSFKQISYIDATEDVDTTKTIDIINYNGYSAKYYTVTNYNNDSQNTGSTQNTINATDSKISIYLEKENVYAKEVCIYYTKNRYNLKVSYELNSTEYSYVKSWTEALNSSLANIVPDTSSAVVFNGEKYYTKYYQIVKNNKYNSIYETESPQLSGFNLSDNQYTKSIVVKVDDENFSINSINFTYNPIKTVMFYYQAVFPESLSQEVYYNSTVLSINQESVEIGERPTNIVIAQLEIENYQFAGWFTDTDCTIPVENINGDVLTGEKQNILHPLGSSASGNYYYAKYEYQNGELTIINTNVPTSDSTQAFEYIVTGMDTTNSSIEIKVCIVGNSSKTITGLPIGNYTVTQTTWAWRYGNSPQTATIEKSSTTTATFKQTMANTKWLDGNSYTDTTLATNGNN